jgi:hypothetical protein
MLAVSGELRHREGGPAQSGALPVRSIYVKKMRNSPNGILHCFDSPQGFVSEPERLDTTTATQSLLLSNSEWPLARARALARAVLGSRTEAGEGDVARAYLMVLGRKASRDDLEAARAFLSSQSRLTGEAFADFCHALLSSNEFLYLH